MNVVSQAAHKGLSSDHETIRNERRLATAGCAIGILHIDTNFPLILGNAQNAATFDFPVRYQLVHQLSISDLLSGSEAATEHVVKAALTLQDAGVAAVIGACGSLINYQSAIANAVEIPVFSSVLITAPLLLSSLGENQKLGIIFASSDSFTSKVRRECGLRDTECLVVADCRDLDAFYSILHNENYLTSSALEDQVVDLATTLACDHPDVGALILQCSELAPYAEGIREATGLPVFDVTTLIRWVHSSVVRESACSTC